ncbi:unnamed protein product [Prunus armeniaca]
MEYEGELDEETEAFGAELESLLQGDLGINIVFILPEKFGAEGDVLSQESFECRLAEVAEALEQQTSTARAGKTAMKLAAEQLCFFEPTKEMANHLRPWFITANFWGFPIPKVMVDGGVAINLLPHKLLIKMGRTEKDLIPTRLTVTNFVGGITKTHGILDVDVIIGTKKLKIAFFMVGKTSTTYNALHGRNWIHQSLCVPSTLHQLLALWHEEGIIMMTLVLSLSSELTRTAVPIVSRPRNSLKEGNLQEEELEFAPAALDDSLPEVEDPLQEINLGTEEDPRHTFINTLLEEPANNEIIALLHDFKDCFAWHYHEMPRLDRGLVEHKLPIKEGYLLVKQARRRMSVETKQSKKK